jgi:hypothetical protein
VCDCRVHRCDLPLERIAQAAAIDPARSSSGSYLGDVIEHMLQTFLLRRSASSNDAHV